MSVLEIKVTTYLKKSVSIFLQPTHFSSPMPPAFGIIEFKVSSIYIVMQSKRENNKCEDQNFRSVHIAWCVV